MRIRAATTVVELGDERVSLQPYRTSTSEKERR
jgi:hypothetical protein